MIDLGNYLHDDALTKKGAKYATEFLLVLPEETNLVDHYYNAANGHSVLWGLNSRETFSKDISTMNCRKQSAYIEKV